MIRLILGRLRPRRRRPPGATEPVPGTGEPAVQPSPGAIPGYVQAAVLEVRARNALIIAWIHVFLRAAILLILAWAAVSTTRPFYQVAVGINLGFLGASVAVLALLWRRWRTPWAIRLLIILDLLSLAIAGWRVTQELPPSEVAVALGLVVSLIHVVLLCGALILGGRDLVVLAALSTLLAGALLYLGRQPQPFTLLMVLGVLVSSVVVVWAGRRIVRLVIKESLAAYSARALQSRHDALDAANRQIREAQAQAQRLTQLVIHDLKNPLTVILTHLFLVRTRIAPIPELTQETEDLQLAEQEGRRLAAMIGDLLLLSRLERGELMAHPTCVRVRDVLGDAGRALGIVAAGKQVRLEVEVPPDLVAPLDANLVRRLVENLVSNAIRHTGPGDRIQIVATSDSEAVRLTVRNTGPAIPEGIRARLFERHATGGLGEWHNVGLGLYMCRLVAEAHGGSIALLDHSGWNVVFEAIFPFKGCPLPPQERSHVGLREEDIQKCALLRQPCSADRGKSIDRPASTPPPLSRGRATGMAGPARAAS